MESGKQPLMFGSKNNNMTSTDIQKHIRQHFLNYEYKLQNTYVFNWECDFFCMSKSCYFVEVEIKVSRGDYFKDFEKVKHKIFKDFSAGKKTSVYKTEYGGKNGDVIVKNFQPVEIKLQGFRSPALAQHKYEKIKNGSEFLIESSRDYFRTRYSDEQVHKPFVTNNWENRLEIVKEKWRCKDLHAPSTNIGYHNFENTNSPNQLYYAVPQGLIKLHELPTYAGLIEINEYGAQLIKKAPYIHKRKLDLDKILLKKFYNLHIYGKNHSDLPVQPELFKT